MDIQSKLSQFLGVNRILQSRFRKWKEKGFTPEQAAAHWSELRTLASPILFARSAFKKDPRLLAVAEAHRHLLGVVSRIETPGDWVRYCKHHPVTLEELSEHLSKRWPESGNVLRDYWPLLAMDEGSVEYRRRITMGQGVEPERVMPSWDALETSIRHRDAMLDLVEQDQPALTPSWKVSWQATLKAVGLRSLRWSYGDEPGPQERQWRLMGALRSAQDRLRRGVGWDGPLLGLAGSTSLALGGNGSSHGVVQPDPGGRGQTLTLSNWSVLAHEWLHALDVRLSRHYGYEKPWATQVILDWREDALPPVPMMAWGLQVSQVMGIPRADPALENIQWDLEKWDERITHSLGSGMRIQEEIGRQKTKIGLGSWGQEDACRGWRRALEDQGDPRVARTAYLLSADTAFSLECKEGKNFGTWPEFMERLRAADALHPVPGLALLLRPVEVLARSFEVALAAIHQRPGGLVWVPSSARPNAGMLWPLPAEAEFQAHSWANTLRALRPLWRDWKRDVSP